MNVVGRQAVASSLILGLVTWLGVVADAAAPAAPVGVAERQQTTCGSTGNALAAAIEPLKALCPSPSSGTSAQCMEALDERYWNRPVQCNAHSNLLADPTRSRWWPQPRNDAVVWRQVFENPAALRQKVEAAARDPACRLREDQFRPDLRTACAADAMVRLGVLHRACRRVLEWEDESNPYFDGWRPRWETWRDVLEAAEGDDYWRPVAELEESELHFAWRLAKCRAVPRSSLALLERMRPPSPFRVRQGQRDQLVVAAARLGSVWAIGVGFLRSSGEGSVAVETWPDAPLPLAYVHWATRSRNQLAYLLAAREEDLAGEAPQFDWRGLEAAFTGEEIDAARPATSAIRAHGWPPKRRALSNSPWPWMDQPTPVRVEVLRRRIDEDGNIRWLYENGLEEWDGGNVTYAEMPGGKTSITGHSRIGRPTLRRWTDVDGTERWIDEVGDEHWIDADGTEHWIELDGTEWMLLPPEPPPRCGWRAALLASAETEFSDEIAMPRFATLRLAERPRNAAAMPDEITHENRYALPQGEAWGSEDARLEATGTWAPRFPSSLARLFRRVGDGLHVTYLNADKLAEHGGNSKNPTRVREALLHEYAHHIRRSKLHGAAFDYVLDSLRGLAGVCEMDMTGRQSAASSGPGMAAEAAAAGASDEVAKRQQTVCGTGTGLVAEIEPLKALCPSPSSAASAQCIEALHERYWDRPVLCDAHSNMEDGPSRPRWWPQPRSDTVVWRQVFENPSALRTEVEAATRDPSCRLRESQFRPDLRTACAADAMARLAVLHRACRRVLDWEDESNPYFDGWRPRWEARRAALDETDDDYRQQVAEVEESELHFAWRLAKCRAVPESALAPLALLRPSSYYVAEHDQRDQLVAAAARLGSVWAISVGASWSSLGQDGRVAVETWRAAPLPLAYIHWAMRSRNQLAYLLAAREEDLASAAPQFDWRGFEAAFTNQAINAAQPLVGAIRAQGWPRCCDRELGNSPWPWMDQPTPMRVQVLRRRIDENFNIRWMYEDGREEWVHGEHTYSETPGGKLYTLYHSRIGMATLRRWTDANGIEHWIDEAGDEHWIDADGAEHWIDLEGTEWILLPPGPPPDE